MSAPEALVSWLRENGGVFHEKAAFKQDDYGYHIIAAENIPAESIVASCPFDLVITEDVAKHAIGRVLRIDTSAITDWTERQWIGTYIVLHGVADIQDKSPLKHGPYIKTLPGPDKLFTPLQFTQTELDLFKGSNLYNATLERQLIWKEEWEKCHAVVAQSIPAAAHDAFTWIHYLTAATYLSSRAFPSSILSPNPTLITDPTTKPVLLPGVDSFNHARGQRVSWLTEYPKPSAQGVQEKPRISLLSHVITPRGSEILNNYGPKPNAELILGYGFSLSNNPDDTMILKLGGSNGKQWEIGRNAANAEGLWSIILDSIKEDPSREATYEDILDAAGMLQEMLDAVSQRLPSQSVHPQHGVRKEVVTMLEHYLEGQNAILESLFQFSSTQEGLAVDMAKAQGIEIVLED